MSPARLREIVAGLEIVGPPAFAVLFDAGWNAAIAETLKRIDAALASAPAAEDRSKAPSFAAVTALLNRQSPPPSDAKEWTCPTCGNDALWCKCAAPAAGAK